MTKEQRIIVTGAGGYVGRHVVAQLLNRGASVVAVVRPGSASEVDTRAERVELDVLGDPQGATSLLSTGPDAVVHLAWEQGFVHNSPAHMRNLSSHFRFLELVVEAGIQRLAILGTAHEVGYHEGAIDADTPTNPTSLYGIAKDALRRAVFASFAGDITLQWMRAFYIVGDDARNNSVFTKILEAAAEGRETFPFTTGTRRFDFIDVEELGNQIAAVSMQSEVGGVINVCSGTSMSLGEQAEKFIAQNGLSIRLEYGAFPDRPYDARETYGDATVVRQLLAAEQAS